MGGIDHDVLFISGRVVLVFHNGIRGDYRIMDSSKKIGCMSKVTLGIEIANSFPHTALDYVGPS